MSSRRWYGGRAPAGVVSLAAALALSGCGGGGDGGGEVASAESGKPEVSASQSAESEIAEYLALQRKWVECLRDEGFDLPDPDSEGRIDGDENRKLKSDPKFAEAQEKCAEFNVPVPESYEKANRPELSKEEIETLQRYAKCMQENGAPDFPDTDEDGYDDEDVQWDSTTTGAKRAERECGPIIGVPSDPPPAKG